MKTVTTLFFGLFFAIISSFGQNKMKITLNDGKIKTGIYEIKNTWLNFPSKTRVISKKGKEKYKLDNIKNIVVYIDNDSLFLEVILTKKYIDSKTEKKLAQKVFAGKKIEMYNVSEIIYRGGSVGMMTMNGYFVKYLRKINEPVSYNIGYIYGAGQRGIKKRVRDYFKDCPSLIEKVDNNKIDKKETLEIAKYYEDNCK